MNKKYLDKKSIFSLALQNHKKNNFIEAEKLYNQVLKEDPEHFESIFYMASLFSQKRNFIKAKEFFERSIKIQPNYAIAYSNLGAVLKELGKFQDAFKACQKAVEIEPNNTIAHSNLGAVLRELGLYKDSVVACKKAIEIDPKNLGAYHNLGLSLQELNEIQKAIACYIEIIKANPNNENAYQNLAKLNIMLGKNDNATNFFNLAIKTNPKNLLNHYNLVDLDIKYLNTNLKETVYKIINEDNLKDKKNLTYANFLMSKYEYKNKNYEREFEYLIKGHDYYFNSCDKNYKKNIEYWLKILPENFDIYNQKILRTKYSNNLEKFSPIFIVGVPRCGSTLVEKIISSGLESIVIGEEVGVFSSFVKDKIIYNQPIYSEIENTNNNIIQRYKNKNIIINNSANIFTDKTLDNFFYLGLIKTIFPSSKIINCKRDPFSSIISILKNNLPQVPWAHSIENIFNYFDIYFHTISKYKKMFPDFIYDLNFENLSNNPEEESKNLMKFCNLPWDSKCLEFYKRKDLISKTASNIQIRQGIYKHSLDKYSSYKRILKNNIKNYEWFK
jgi:tetratricopeptide (TPR) repeat protein